MQETWVWSLGWKIPLEEDMATHSSILAWRIPTDRGVCGLQSTGSQRAGHNGVTKYSTVLPHCWEGRLAHKLSGGQFGFMALKDEHISEGQPHSQASPTSTHGQMPWPGSWRQCSVQSRRGRIHILPPSAHQQLPTGGAMKKGKCRVSSASGRSSRSPLLMSAQGQEAWWPVGRGHYACCLGSWYEYGFNLKPKHWPCWLWEVDRTG